MSAAMPIPAAAGAVTYAAAPTYTVASGAYQAAAPVTYSTAAAPQVTYMQAGAAAPQVTYMQAGAGAAYAAAPPMEPSVYSAAPVAGASYVLPQQYAQPAPVSYMMAPTEGAATMPQPMQMPYTTAAPATYTMQPGGAYPAALQPAPSMVAYPGAAAYPGALMQPMYTPTSVQAAWDNHFGAFGEQNLDKIMLDYDETSVVRLYNNTTGEKKEFRGTAQIREMFAGLFAELYDKTTLSAPVIDVEEEPKQVFLIWSCPGCGYKTATDTFIFGPDLKIKRQNIVVTKESVAAAVPTPAAPAAMSSASAAAAPASGKKGSSKKASSSSASKKKKSKGLC